MAEIITGRIIGIDPDGITVRVPFRDWERFTARAYDEVLMELPDTRRRSPEQLRKAWAIMSDMALYMSGDKRCAEEDVYQPMRAIFAAEHQKTLQKRLYHLSESSMTEARDFINFLLDQCLEMDIPLSRPASELTDDIQHYVYQCTLARKCAVCGKRAELHHVSRVGMGRNRHEIDHEGMKALPLCRDHHGEAHDHGDAALMEKYHLEPIIIDRRIIERLKIGRTS